MGKNGCTILYFDKHTKKITKIDTTKYFSSYLTVFYL